MIFFTLFCVLVLFSSISVANANRHMATRTDVNSKFAGLLKDLISINERRLKAMKELASLQDYSTGIYHLRAGREYFDKQKNGRPLVVMVGDLGPYTRILLNKMKAVWINEDPEPHRAEPQYFCLVMIPKSDSSSSEDNSVEVIASYRKNSVFQCGKKLEKHCFKACVTTSKDVCKEFRCKKRTKTNFRIECKRRCRFEFRKGRFSDGE